MRTFLFILSILICRISFGQVNQNVGDFQQLKVSKNLSVELIKSDKNTIEISDPEVANKVSFANKNGVLKVGLKIEDFLKGETSHVTLYYKDLNNIFADAGAEIFSKGTVDEPSLTLKANKGSVIRLDVKTGKLSSRINSGGEITLTGTADAQDVNAISGGRFQGEQLKTSYTTVTVNAGGQASVFSSGSTDAQTRAGGTIDIYGDSKVSQKTIAGGTIHVHK